MRPAALRPGERLPSVRELARELAVNQNTILRVYERLCGEGLLEMRHGQGTFVAARAKRGQLAVHRERLVDELRQIARQAVGLGLSTDELHELLAEAADGVEQPLSRRRERGAQVMNEPAIELQAVYKSFRRRKCSAA